MKKIILLCVLVFVLLTSCQSPRQTETDDSRGYVPKEDWEGLETKEYFYLDDVLQSYVLAYEKTGTPDPIPRENDCTEPVDASQIVCKTTEKEYSLADLGLITVEVTYLKNDSVAIPSEVQLHYHVNVERWNGTSWERLLYVPRYLYVNVEYQTNQTINPGETATEVISTKQMITSLTPGKYRAVAYVNYRPVYAEFELVE